MKFTYFALLPLVAVYTAAQSSSHAASASSAVVSKAASATSAVMSKATSATAAASGSHAASGSASASAASASTSKKSSGFVDGVNTNLAVLGLGAVVAVAAL
ncbi:uncharacterized protein I303_105488 [Kwoniella dejecticola CBS 10117]|uniref:Uncharacterized protein n=1 Tax=Kwoniella dejecticola CBS 10117 TaxID=1296121 RepID=A0A1A6A2C2_9TREE|nr:uncharacterized protein I303_05069 [Kwoniella dejecticola CBS 10117]OBR84212.1 hypothetical protein I303_05069 [Kwoniella dejecticola CBS 10117]